MRVFTSIPPRYADPARLEYLKACVQSWTNCGFQAFSLNRQEEVETVTQLGLMDVIPVETSEAWYPARYGPCFGNIFDIAGNDEPVAVINADIYMLGGPDLSRTLADICSGGFTVARRTDIDFLDAQTGKVSYGGIDLVAFVKSSISTTVKDAKIRRFQLGVPWWDYVIPLMASFEGPTFRIDEPFILHKTHEDRWDMEVWHNISREVRHILDDCAPSEFFVRHPAGEMQTANACLDWLFKRNTMSIVKLPIDTGTNLVRTPKLVDTLAPETRFQRLTALLSRLRTKGASGKQG